MKWKQGVLIAAAVLALVLLFGATGNRHSGNRVIITCGPVDLAFNDDFDLCTFDVPQRMFVESVQAQCEGIASDPTFQVQEGGVGIHVATNFVAGDPTFPTLTDTNLDDEDEIMFVFVADADDTGTNCTAMIVGRLR